MTFEASTLAAQREAIEHARTGRDERLDPRRVGGEAVVMQFGLVIGGDAQLADHRAAGRRPQLELEIGRRAVEPGLGGLASQMPILAAFLMLFTFSSVGLPGLNGFVSEFTVLFAAYNSPVLGPLFGALGATGILLGAIYMLYMAGKVLFGPLQ